MFQALSELLFIANERGVPLWKVILGNECRLSGLSEEEIFNRLERRYNIMVQSAHKALEQPLPTTGGLISGICSQQYAYAQTAGSLCGRFLCTVMAMALSCSETNASMGKVCAAPTAGSCGIIPAVLIGVEEAFQLTRREALQGLLTASGIGAVFMKNATVSGAEGGCQAECGVAAAMASAAAVEMAGGSPEKAINACCISLINVMGLICDPIAGLVQVPCAQRNASQAINALCSADLALAGMRCMIDPDEVIDAMYKVGKLLPMQLRETSLGGIASTPSGIRIKNEIFGRKE